MPESVQCVICGAGFRPNVLRGGKCEVCRKKYPDATSRKELVSEDVMKEKENRGHIQNIVDLRVEELLLKHDILSRCPCGNLYKKGGPNHKYCKECSGNTARKNKIKVETGE